MSNIRQASARDLAGAMVAAATTAGAASTAVRGADWRLGVVTAVNSDGTVDVGEIRARCLGDAYPNPAVADTCVITQNSQGNWLAIGRTSSGGDTAWTTPTLASGYTHNGNENGTLQWRIRVETGIRYIEFRGSVNVPGSVGTGASTIFTLPVGSRPAVRLSVATAKNGEGHKVDINTTGVVATVSGASVAYQWVSIYGMYPLD